MVPGLPEVSGGSGGSGGSGENEFAGQTFSDRLPVAGLTGNLSPAFIRCTLDASDVKFSRQVFNLVFCRLFRRPALPKSVSPGLHRNAGGTR